ncbi:MAG: amidohydrolase family protein [Bacillota bacterium]
MYNTEVGGLPDTLASVKEGKLFDPIGNKELTGRTIFKGGTVVDPKHDLKAVKDIAVAGEEIVAVEDSIEAQAGDKVIDCTGLLVVPGLVDIHLHLGDLFEVSTAPIQGAVADGVTMGLSPGAGNTFMAPSLLGAEIDRGLPLNLGLYLGAPNVLGTMLSTEEIIKLFKGELSEEAGLNKMTRNRITYLTAPLTVGIKDHMGHFIMSDDDIKETFEITSKSDLLFMSHTQDPAHAERLAQLSNGSPLHLGHTTAAGCGSHDDPVSGMKRMIDLCQEDHITGEFVTTMLRSGLGSREGLQMTRESQQLAYQALEDGTVDILISDGQNDATMKGFGDTRDNIPALMELAEKGILSLSDSIATMTSNPARLMSERTNNDWWTEKVGNLGVGALANITVIDQVDKLATYTMVNGQLVGFENRTVRRGNGAGGWISKFGKVERMGVGDLVTFSYL